MTRRARHALARALGAGILDLPADWYPPPAPPTHWGWWVTDRGDRLHYLAQADLRAWGDARDRWYGHARDAGGAVTRAFCGRRARYEPAGALSRMGRWRCAGCCRALGIAVGRGTPRNEMARRAGATWRKGASCAP